MASNKEMCLEWTSLPLDTLHWTTQDVEVCAELGRTLLERNEELEKHIRDQQHTIEDHLQEIQFLTKQNNAMKEENGVRMKFYEQLEATMFELERTNDTLVTKHQMDKKRMQSLCENIDYLEQKCEEMTGTLETIRKGRRRHGTGKGMDKGAQYAHSDSSEDDSLNSLHSHRLFHRPRSQSLQDLRDLSQPGSPSPHGQGLDRDGLVLEGGLGEGHTPGQIADSGLDSTQSSNNSPDLKTSESEFMECLEYRIEQLLRTKNKESEKIEELQAHIRVLIHENQSLTYGLEALRKEKEEEIMELRRELRIVSSQKRKHQQQQASPRDSSSPQGQDSVVQVEMGSCPSGDSDESSNCDCGCNPSQLQPSSLPLPLSATADSATTMTTATDGQIFPSSAFLLDPLDQESQSGTGNCSHSHTNTNSNNSSSDPSKSKSKYHRSKRYRHRSGHYCHHSNSNNNYRFSSTPKDASLSSCNNYVNGHPNPREHHHDHGRDKKENETETFSNNSDSDANNFTHRTLSTSEDVDTDTMEKVRRVSRRRKSSGNHTSLCVRCSAEMNLLSLVNCIEDDEDEVEELSIVRRTNVNVTEPMAVSAEEFNSLEHELASAVGLDFAKDQERNGGVHQHPGNGNGRGNEIERKTGGWNWSFRRPSLLDYFLFGPQQNGESPPNPNPVQGRTHRQSTGKNDTEDTSEWGKWEWEEFSGSGNTSMETSSGLIPGSSGSGCDVKDRSATDPFDSKGSDDEDLDDEDEDACLRKDRRTEKDGKKSDQLLAQFPPPSQEKHSRNLNPNPNKRIKLLNEMESVEEQKLVSYDGCDMTEDAVDSHHPHNNRTKNKEHKIKSKKTGLVWWVAWAIGVVLGVLELTWTMVTLLFFLLTLAFLPKSCSTTLLALASRFPPSPFPSLRPSLSSCATPSHLHSSSNAPNAKKLVPSRERRM